MAASNSKKIVSLFVALMILLGNLPGPRASASAEETWVNLLAADMDTGFDGGISPFTLQSNTGGSQQVVQINGNNAIEFRDSSLGSNALSSFNFELTSGTLLSRINEIYSMPIGSQPVEFVFEYGLRRGAASDKPVNRDIYAEIQFGNYDNNLIPRFPVPEKLTITGTAAYLNPVPDELKKVNDGDIAGYRFTIVPNGGQRLVSTLKIAFKVRVDTGGTDEAIVVDDLAIHEVRIDASSDTEAPTAPTGLIFSAKTDTSIHLSWTESTDNVGVTRYDIYQNGQLTGLVGGGSTNYAVTGLSPNATYLFTVRSRDRVGNQSDFSNALSVTTNPSAGGLPEPLGNQDIGAVGLAGNANYFEDTGTIRIQSSGSDIGGTSDSYHFVYRPWTGNGEIVARVSSLENAVAGTKAGVMIRQSLSSQISACDVSRLAF